MILSEKYRPGKFEDVVSQGATISQKKKTKGENNMKRREFLRTGLALGAATALSDDIATGITETAKAENAEPEIIRRFIDIGESFDLVKTTPPPETFETLTITCGIQLFPLEPPPPVVHPNNDDLILSKGEIERLLGGLASFEGKQKDYWDQIGRLRKELLSNAGIKLCCWGSGLDLLDTESEVRYEFIFEPLYGDGSVFAKGTLFPDRYLAFDGGKATEKIPGIETLEPLRKTPALWIEESVKEQAERCGYVVVEPNKVIIAHFAEMLRYPASDVLTVDMTQDMLNHLRKTSPVIVDNVLKVLDIGQIRSVLRHLLYVRKPITPITQLGTILETVLEVHSSLISREDMSPHVNMITLSGRVARKLYPVNLTDAVIKMGTEAEPAGRSESGQYLYNLYHKPGEYTIPIVGVETIKFVAEYPESWRDIMRERVESRLRARIESR